MAAPFFSAIKGTTSGTPGTGAFTPSAAASTFEPWSGVPTGWIGLVRYDDGTAWERSYSYWNGTTLSRSTTQFVASSTGSALSLTSAATATMVIDPDDVQPHLGGQWFGSWRANAGVNSVSASGFNAPIANGSIASSAVSNASFLSEQGRVKYTSATTASALAGVSLGAFFIMGSSTAGHGGWEFASRWGASGLPTGPRLLVGATSNGTMGANEPSAVSGYLACFAKDSTDTNIQLMTRNSITTTKVDTGIPLVANGWYEAALWTLPGSLTVYALLMRLDTGDIWYMTQATTVPPAGITLAPAVLGGLNATNTGTAFVMEFGSASVKIGS